jgi:hypothetical protein
MVIKSKKMGLKSGTLHFRRREGIPAEEGARWESRTSVKEGARWESRTSVGRVICNCGKGFPLKRVRDGNLAPA